MSTHRVTINFTLGESNDERPFEPGELIYFSYNNSILLVKENAGDGFGTVQYLNEGRVVDDFEWNGGEETRRVVFGGSDAAA